MKEKALVLSLSKWEIDGSKGGKISWCTFDRTSTENRKGIEILSAPCPYAAFEELQAVPCVAELDLSMSAMNVNGKAIAKVIVSGVKPLEDKSVQSNCLKLTLTA